MKKLTSLQKLDFVLKYIANEPDKKLVFNKIITNTAPYINENEIVIGQILDKLVKDSYVSKGLEMVYTNIAGANIPKMDTVYSITFDGNSFLKYPGGYEDEEARFHAESIRVERLETTQIQLQKSVRNLTFWIAVATVATGLYYFYLFFQDMCNCRFFWQK